MTPFAKPVAAVVKADLQALIDNQAAECRYFEFKADIPVSDEEQRRQRSTGADRPVDRGWLSGKPRMAFGRDKLMEELVAFANADGRVPVIGLTECDDTPHAAKGINPLPGVVDLERRLRDARISCDEDAFKAELVVIPRRKPKDAAKAEGRPGTKAGER